MRDHDLKVIDSCSRLYWNDFARARKKILPELHL